MITLAKWSVEDYHRMIEAGILRDRRVELLAGEIVEMSPESPLHYTLGEDTTDYLKSLLSRKAHVRFHGPITLSDSEPEPDIAIVRLPRERYRQRHPHPEDIFWLIEVSDSTLAWDLDRKSLIYAQAGILEYWVIDVKNRTMIVFRQPHLEGYKAKQEISTGAIIPLAFPDIIVSIERLFQGFAKLNP